MIASIFSLGSNLLKNNTSITNTAASNNVIIFYENGKSIFFKIFDFLIEINFAGLFKFVSAVFPLNSKDLVKKIIPRLFRVR